MTRLSENILNFLSASKFDLKKGLEFSKIQFFRSNLVAVNKNFYGKLLYPYKKAQIPKGKLLLYTVKKLE